MQARRNQQATQRKHLRPPSAAPPPVKQASERPRWVHQRVHDNARARSDMARVRTSDHNSG
ncbi:hypothetical protein RSSE_p1284 (plasmid) [Ralstonia solanacearum]|nr:hypothetical protein RSSE_p1284 [Ralstonia solanacearum]